MDEKVVRRLRFAMSVRLANLADETADYVFSAAAALLDPLATDEELAAEFYAADMVGRLEKIVAEAKRIEADAAATEAAVHYDRQADWAADDE